MNLPGPLVDAEWLLEHISEPDLVVAEVRWAPNGSGPAMFEEGHIPGAVYVDVDADLAARPAERGGRHPLPEATDFARRMGELGIGNEDAVVAYDDARGSHAARLWWMLTATGRAAAVLDGGLGAWTGPLENGAMQRAPVAFAARPWPKSEIVDAEEVSSLLGKEAAVVVDARAPERYRGDFEPIDARAGHIPGAVNAPWTRNVDLETGRFLPSDELRRRYGALGVSDATSAIAHCGSGVTACHDVLAMEVAGLGRPRLYVGSWSDWISDPSRPVATGDAP